MNIHIDMKPKKPTKEEQALIAEFEELYCNRPRPILKCKKCGFESRNRMKFGYHHVGIRHMKHNHLFSDL